MFPPVAQSATANTPAATANTPSVMDNTPSSLAAWTKRLGRVLALSWVLSLGVSCGWLASSTSAQGQEDSVADESENEARFLSNIRQLTFEGRRAGEGYFNREGNLLVFQSEREEGNPFFQIYLMDLESGDVERVSPGSGKTTCAWIHPESRQVLFASTHEDPEAQAKQQAEIDLRASGMERRYSWDYDPTFELFAWDRDSGDYHRLTDAKGYDAEASWSPDGSRIVFTSNRSAYDHELTEAESK